MAEGYVFTSATDVNDLLNQIVSQAAVHGWTQHNLSGLGGGAAGSGRRGHFSKDGVVVNLASYAVNASSQTVENEMLNAVLPSADRAFNDSTYQWWWSSGGVNTTPDILCINASTGYDSGSNWYQQPGADSAPGEPNKGRFQTIRAKGAIGKVYMFFLENPAAFYVVCEVRPGEFYWLTAGRIDKDYDFPGGQFYGASLNDTNTTTSYPANLNVVDARFDPSLDVVPTKGNGWGASYIPSPTLRESGASNNMQSPDRVPGYTTIHYSNSVDMHSDVINRGYLAATGRLWIHPPFVYAVRPNSTKSYVGTLPHIHYCTTENFVGADIVTIGGEEYMVFPANWRASPYNNIMTQDSGQAAPWYRNNNYGSGFAIRKPS